MSHTCYGEGCEICELHELQEQFTHWSDCAQHNEPAEPAGPCDCGMYHIPTLERVHEELTTLRAKVAAMQGVVDAAEKVVSFWASKGMINMRFEEQQPKSIVSFVYALHKYKEVVR